MTSLSIFLSNVTVLFETVSHFIFKVVFAQVSRFCGPPVTMSQSSL